MSLKISLENCHKRPGFFFSATVTAIIPLGMELMVQDYRICLRGRSFAAVTGSIHARTIFLQIEKQLYEKPISLRKDPHAQTSTSSIHRRPIPQTLPPSADLGDGISIHYDLEASADDQDGVPRLTRTAPLLFSLIRPNNTPHCETTVAL